MNFLYSPTYSVPKSIRRIYGPHCTKQELDLYLEQFWAFPEVQEAFKQCEDKIDERRELLYADFERIYPQYRAKFEERLEALGYEFTKK